MKLFTDRKFCCELWWSVDVLEVSGLICAFPSLRTPFELAAAVSVVECFASCTCCYTCCFVEARVDVGSCSSVALWLTFVDEVVLFC